MEEESDSLFIKKSIKKINRNYSSNMFSEKLNKNLIFIIMNYLKLENRCKFRESSIFINNTFIDYENKKIYEEILKEIKKKDSIFRINLKNNKQGFCFLCEIPYEYRYDNTTESIIINNDFINELEENKLKIINNNKIIEVDINNKFKHIDKDYNITIINLEKSIYEFKNYFEVNNIFKYENDNEESKIYILYYSNDKQIKISFGELKKTGDKKIFIFLNSKNDFPFGSPIFDYRTKILIGYYKGYNSQKNYNEGQYMRYPLNNFIYENHNHNLKFISYDNYSNNQIIKKIKLFIDNPDEKFAFYDYDEELYDTEFFGNCHFIIKIIDECPYKGGKFLFSFHFHKNHIYSKPPKIELINKIYHPNFKGEENCILYNCNERNLMGPKKPHYHPRKLKELMENCFIFNNINESLNLIYSLIIHPSLEEGDIINRECAEQMKKNKNKYETIAKLWTEEDYYYRKPHSHVRPIFQNNFQKLQNPDMNCGNKL